MGKAKLIITKSHEHSTPTSLLPVFFDLQLFTRTFYPPTKHATMNCSLGKKLHTYQMKY